MKKLKVILLIVFLIFVLSIIYIFTRKNIEYKYLVIEKENGSCENGSLTEAITLDYNDFNVSLTKFDLTSNTLDYTFEIAKENNNPNIDIPSIKFDCIVYDENYNLISEYLQTGSQIAKAFFEENKKIINMDFDEFYYKFQKSKEIEPNHYMQDTELAIAFDENSKKFNFSRMPIKDFEISDQYYIRIYNLTYDYYDNNSKINTFNCSDKIFEFEINKK